MFDGFKTLHPNLRAGIWEQSELLSFGLTVDESTGEIMSTEKKATYKGLTFWIKPSTVHEGQFVYGIHGSLHKYHNNGLNNATEFTFSELLNTLADLSKRFGLDTGQAYLHGLEIGINIPLPFSPQRVLSQAICYKNRPFVPIDRRKCKMGLICSLNEYEVKLYDKGSQSQQKSLFLLRFEVKVRKMRFLQPYGISTLSDLGNSQKAVALLDLLLNVLSGIVFFDTSINTGPLSGRERQWYSALGNPIKWQNMAPMERSRSRARLEAFIQIHSKQYIKPLLKGLIIERWNRLFAGCQKSEGMLRFHRLSELSGMPPNVKFSQLEYVGEIISFCIWYRGTHKYRIPKDMGRGSLNRITDRGPPIERRRWILNNTLQTIDLHFENNRIIQNYGPSKRNDEQP